MSQAKRDENRVTGLLGETSLGTGTTVPVYVDPTTHRLYVDSLLNSASVTQTIAKFGLNQTESPSTTLTYLGKETKDGEWLIVSIDSTSGVTMTYATVTNNPTVTTYADAWAARATTLVYGTYSQAF